MQSQLPNPPQAIFNTPPPPPTPTHNQAHTAPGSTNTLCLMPCLRGAAPPSRVFCSMPSTACCVPRSPVRRRHADAFARVTLFHLKSRLSRMERQLPLREPVLLQFLSASRSCRPHPRSPSPRLRLKVSLWLSELRDNLVSTGEREKK